MDVREAVEVAKDYVTGVYAGEDIANLGLEEVEFDDRSGTWSVTLGFSRPWDHRSGILQLTEQKASARSYKVVRIADGTGEVKSLKDRILVAAR